MMELYPITPAQNLQYKLLVKGKQPQILNICVSLLIHIDMDFDLLARAIHMAIERDDSCRICFTPPDENGQIKQYVGHAGDVAVSFADLSDMSEIDALHVMRKWSEMPFEPRSNRPLCEIKMLKAYDGYNGAYICIDHMVSDSSSMILLMCDVIELYAHMAFGTAMPDDRQSYIASLKRYLERIADPVKVARDRDFWTAEVSRDGEPLYADVGGARYLNVCRERLQKPDARYALSEWKDLRVGQFTYILEPEPAHRLLDFCQERSISMTNFLLMGLRTYLSHQNNGQQDISVRNYVSRRIARADRLTGGVRIHWYPCRTILSPERKFLEGVEQIAQIQSKIYRHTDFDPLEVDRIRHALYHAPDDALYESAALTYQPFPMRLKEDSLNALEYVSLWHVNGTATQPLYLTVMHRPNDSGMDFYFKYQAALYSDVQVRDVYYYLMRILFRVTQYPDATIQEILDWI